MQAWKFILKTKSTNSQSSFLSGHTTSKPMWSLKVHFIKCRMEGEKESFLLVWEDCYQTSTKQEYWSMNLNQSHLYPMLHKLLRINVHTHPRTVLNKRLDLSYPVCNEEWLFSNTSYFIILLWLVSRLSVDLSVPLLLSYQIFITKLIHVFSTTRF